MIQLVRNLSHLPQRLLKTDAIDSLCKVREQHGQNLLHEAIVQATHDTNLYATVRLLLYVGCDPNAVDKIGNAPLHYLAQIYEQYSQGDLPICSFIFINNVHVGVF